MKTLLRPSLIRSVKVGYSKRVLSDLSSIAAYLSQRSPPASASVRSAILEAIAIIATFPGLGRQLVVPKVRRFVETAYVDLTCYTHELNSEIRIIRVIHPRQRRPFDDP